MIPNTLYQDLEAATLPRIEIIMGKKAEGRPISPEEYRELHNFNSRIESGLIKERQKVTKQQKARIEATKKAVPNDAYDLPIMTLGLPTKVENLLGEAGYSNVGELAYRLLLVPDSINNIDGIGPSYIKQIESALEVMIGYQPLPEELAVPEEVELEDDSPAADADETDAEETDAADAKSSDAEEETKSDAEETEADADETAETDTDENETGADETEADADETAETDAEETETGADEAESDIDKNEPAADEADPDLETDEAEDEDSGVEAEEIVEDDATETAEEKDDAETETQDEE